MFEKKGSSIMKEDNQGSESQPALEKPAEPEFESKRDWSVQRRWFAAFLFLGLVFMAGLLPMWRKAAHLSREMNVIERERAMLQLENLAGAAAIDARRGEYEAARQATSRFFTELRSEIDAGSASSLRQSERESLKGLLDQRDDLITLLARSDPASAERLTSLYLGCRNALRLQTTTGR